MIARALAIVCLLLAPAAEAQETARIVYLGVQGDPAYEPQPVYTGLSLRDRHRPADGARAGLGGTRVLERALGIAFVLDEVMLAPGDDPAEAVSAEAGSALAVLLDLPEDQMTDAVAAADESTLLFNIRHTDGHWRGAGCAPMLLHTAPSRAMRAEALAQYLRAKDWRRVLLLAGPTEEDAAEAAAARAAAGKLGLEIAAERAFELTNDPRRRDLSNIALLTGGAGHDVVWLVDGEGEFGRYLPYATHDPRPVVGSEGLSPVAWHWTWERHGAPQLNQRFRRKAGRDMSPEDWAAWAAVRAVVEAVQRLAAEAPGAAPNPARVAATVQAGDFAFDLYKGVRGSFRPWDGQLRQTILLATHNAVISTAPVDGFEHEVTTLDTLGAGPSESTCAR